MSDAPIADRAAIRRVGDEVRRRLAADPLVYRFPEQRAELIAVHDFIAPAECGTLMQMIDRVARPSSVFDEPIGSPYRTSYSGDMERDDSFVQMIERRISDLLGINQSWGETVQGQRYAVGQEFQAHFDAFDTTAPYWPAESAGAGQRCWTAMVYLNAVEAGGATHFPALGLSIPPQPGLLLAWNNALPDGRLNPDVMHAGTPVIQGVKYIITKWYRTRRWP